MKSLVIIQKLSKIGKILSKIFYYLFIAAAGIVAMSIGVVLIVSKMNFSIENLSFAEYMFNETGIQIGFIYAILILALIGSIFEAILCKKAYKYFDKELEDATPFTYDGAEAMCKLGMLQIGFSVFLELYRSVLNAKIEASISTVNVDLSDEFSISLGLMFIILSIIFRYGADILEENKKLVEKEQIINAASELKKEVKKIILKQLPKKEENDAVKEEVKKEKKVVKKPSVKKETTKKATTKKTTAKKSTKKVNEEK